MSTLLTETILQQIEDYVRAADERERRLCYALAASALAAAEDYLGYPLASAEAIEYYDGPAGPRLWLRRRPVVAIEAIHVDGAVPPAWDETSLVDSDYYVFDAAAGCVTRRAGTWPAGIANIRIEYTAGYAQIPAWALQALRVTIGYWWPGAASGADGIQAENLGAYSATYRERMGLPREARELLSPHRSLTI